MNKIVTETMENLKRNGFAAEYFTTSREAYDYLMDAVKSSQSVGFGGSWTLKELGLFDGLKERGNEAYWHWFPGEDSVMDVLKKDMVTDIYMSGANAITLDGRIVNIDGTGNRLSSLLFGHQHLYIVAGINKICKNYEEAIIRIKNEACPKNAKRLGLNTPCAVLGKCTSCDSPDRMCNATLILERQPGGIPTTIVLVGERLGF